MIIPTYWEPYGGVCAARSSSPRARPPDSNRRHCQPGAIGLHDSDAAAGGGVGAGDAPDRIVDSYGAPAVDDRLFQREHPADQRFGALVEKPIALADGGIVTRNPPPQQHRSRGKNREHQHLQLPGRMDRERYQPDQQRGEPEPEQEDPGREQLQRHQDEAEDQPVPGAQRGKHLGHDMTPQGCGVVGGGGFGPALGTDGRRAAACADSALSPKAALAISPIPASEPSRLTASIGSMITFWFGESANCPNALM